MVNRCSFEACSFDGIGFAVRPDEARAFRDAARLATTPWAELQIGSNLVQGASGVIQVMGEKQIFLERGKSDIQLLLTMDIYDGDGSHAAKLRRNAWAFHNPRFDITTQPSSLTLVNKESDEVVVEASVKDRDTISVDRGHFFAPNGVEIRITPDELRIGAAVLMNNLFRGVNAMLTIGPNGELGIG
jgi:hypothetical protein